MRRVGDIALVWGESLRWDDHRQRLYFVDCARQSLHWLEGGEPPLETMPLPSLPTGIVLAESGALVMCMADGLHVVDPETRSVDLLAEYPEGMHGRANDANGDGAGGLVTGTLNLGPGAGGLWSFATARGWRQLDDDFGNCNGPVVVMNGYAPTLVVGDTVAGLVYAYDYDAAARAATGRRVLSDHRLLDGAPDGAAVDSDGHVWSCVLRSGRLAELSTHGVVRTIEMPMANPSDVAFGGRNLDQLFVTSIALDLGDGDPGEEAGRILAIDDTGAVGRPEPRFAL